MSVVFGCYEKTSDAPRHGLPAHTTRSGHAMSTTTRTSYTFSLTLEGDESIVNDKNTEVLYGGGCDDAMFGAEAGVPYIDFEREADSLADAVGSAIRDVERAGLKVVGMEVIP